MVSYYPYIIDTTLRDGEQAPGVVFSKRDKWRIAELLEELGIDEVEAGTPAIGREEQEAIEDIANAGFSFVTSCWCRAKIDDIIQAAKLGTQSINISLPVSDIQIETLGKNKEWVLKELKQTLSFAKRLFSKVTMGAQDASRTDMPFLKEFIFYAFDAGADRIRVSDTVGIFDPIETFEFAFELKKCFPNIELEFHGHNDFGMATANAIAAIKAGIKCISATVNGIGERAGNSALEEITAFLSFKGIKHFNTSVINKLSSFVAKKANIPIPYAKAIVGKNAFKHESGIHTSAILKNIKSYQALNPADYGINPKTFSFGKHSGKSSVINFFKSKELYIDESLAQTILVMVKHIVSTRKIPVTENELLSLYLELTREMELPVGGIKL